MPANLSGMNAIMKPLLAGAVKMAGKGGDKDKNRKKAEVKLKMKASAKVKRG